MGAYLNRPRIFLRRRPIAVASIYNADMSEARRLHRETKDEGLASSAKELSSESPGWGTRQMAGMISSAVSSVLFHATLILLLSAVLIVTHGRRIPTVMTVTLEEIPKLGEFLEIVEMIVPEKPLPAALVNAAPLDVRAEPKVEPPDQSDSADDRAEGPVVATVSLQTAPAEPVWTRDPLGGGLVGRGGRTKAQLARERGGPSRPLPGSWTGSRAGTALTVDTWLTARNQRRPRLGCWLACIPAGITRIPRCIQESPTWRTWVRRHMTCTLTTVRRRSCIISAGSSGWTGTWN